MSDTCPACQGPRGDQKVLCFLCFALLPQAAQNAISSRAWWADHEAWRASVKAVLKQISAGKSPAEVTLDA